MEITFKSLARGTKKVVKGGYDAAKKGAGAAAQFKADVLSDPERYADVPSTLGLMIDRIIKEQGKKGHEETALHRIKLVYRPHGNKIRITVGGDSKVEGVKAALDKQSFPYEPSGDARCIIVDVAKAAVKALGYKIEGQED